MSQFKTSRFAKLNKVLVYVDGPQLVLLTSSQHHPMLAVAVDDYNLRYPLFACEITQSTLKRYMTGKLDLRSIFLVTSDSRRFFVDFSSLSRGSANLYRPSKSQLEDERYLPERGIFSDIHNFDDDEDAALEDTGQAKYFIDGKWEAREFSRLFGKIADIYSLTAIASDLGSGEASGQDIEFLRDSIADKPWKGGGSYLSFYGSVKSQSNSIRPLDMNTIHYSSPGFMEVTGDQSTLGDIDKIVSNFMISRASLDKTYKAIRKTLSQHGALRANQEYQLPTQRLNEYIYNQSIKFANMIGIPNSEKVFIACDKNVVVFAKLILSFSRRVSDLSSFYMEGRVRSEKVSFETIADYK